jgi:hypothetical protein
MFDYHLAFRIKHSCALALVRVVQIKLTTREVERRGLCVCPNFAESQLTVGGEPNLAARRRWNHAKKGQVIAQRARDRDMTDGVHFGQRVDETLSTGSQLGQTIGISVEIYEYSTPEDLQPVG